MRVRIYIDGHPDWRDEGEGYARVPGHSGTLVQGSSGHLETRRRAKRQEYKARKAAEEAA